MTDTNRPSEAAILEAANRLGYNLTPWAQSDIMLAYAAMIEKYEPETVVDPVILRAREICAELAANSSEYESGALDRDLVMVCVVTALRRGMPT